MVLTLGESHVHGAVRPCASDERETQNGLGVQRVPAKASANSEGVEVRELLWIRWKNAHGKWTLWHVVQPGKSHQTMCGFSARKDTHEVKEARSVEDGCAFCEGLIVHEDIDNLTGANLT